jgi:glycosyltransferase involved in cell wall biosynthesis
MATVGENAGRALHIGVNAHLLSLAQGYRSAGINWYIHNLLRHLPGVDPEIGYTVFLGTGGYSAARSIRLQVSRVPTGRPPVRILWEQAFQPWAVRRARVDLLHGPAFVGPLASGCPSVVTFHDLSFLFYPQGFRRLNRTYLRTFGRLSAGRARRVIAVSESTKRDLVKCYGLPPDRIDVVYNGVDAGFRPMPTDRVNAFRSREVLPERFILFVGTLEPRKNVTRLIEAYARLPKGRPPLVLVGSKGWLYDEIFARVEALGLQDEVRFAGYVPADALPYWYNAAELLAYPSLYEGFGLPPLEAMACGTPVVTSTASSLPEVVGNAGLLVDPTDVEALAAAMERVLSEPDLRRQMQAAGLARARHFSWETTARRTVETYRRALRSGEDKAGV